MSSIYDWSTTEASNATADSGINWQEGQLPSTVNNSARYMMRRGKELLNDLGFVGTSGGTANTITLTASSPFSAYADGMFVTFRAAVDNTGAATLNVNSIGAKNIYKNSLKGEPQLVGGEIQAGSLCKLVYVASLNSAAGGWMIVDTSKTPVGRGDLYGLTLSNSAGDPTNDIDIAAGECASESGSPILMTLASSLTKRLDAAWAVGSGNGGLDTGSIGNNTYHIWLIQRSDTGVVDALFSLSATAPTMPANYDRKRRIGAILRESGAIVRFLQYGDTFLRAKVTDVSVVSFYASTGTTLSVPALIQVQPIMGIQVTASAASDVTLAMGSGTDLSTEIIGVLRSLSSNTASGWISSGIMTNTSRQIYTAVIGSGTVAGVIVTTKGWIDTRGRV